MNLRLILFIMLLSLFFQNKAFLMVLKDSADPNLNIEEKDQEEDVSSIENNPFLTFDEEEDFSPFIYRETIRMDLTAVFYTPPKSKIIVDGRIYEEGDIISNKRIVKINPEEAVLKDAKGEYLLKLNGVLGEVR